MQRMQKSLHALHLKDDFLFAKVMSDKEICRKVLEKILGISIKKIEMPTTQKTIDLLFDGKGIRLDVYVNDDEGTIYNVEMQQGRRKGLSKRTRYYQGSIDLDRINAGADYLELKKSFVIFICCFDPFQEQRHIYTFENLCRENPSLALGDETTKIFLNTRGTMCDIDSEMLEFLAYVENTTDTFATQAASPLIKEIHKKVIHIKQNREMEVEYMTLLQRDRENIELGREEGLLEGRQEGREEGRIYTTKIIKLYNRNTSIEDIASSLQLDPKYVSAIIDDYENL